MSWKAEETAAARWRRSNSACWAAGSLGGAGWEVKVDERRWEKERRRLLNLRGRRGGISVVFGWCCCCCGRVWRFGKMKLEDD